MNKDQKVFVVATPLILLGAVLGAIGDEVRLFIRTWRASYGWLGRR